MGNKTTSLRCFDQKRLCTARILNKETPIDLIARFSVSRTLSGGKSGAFLFLVNPKREKGGTAYILKVYPDAYKNEQQEVLNERPFREVLTLCNLSSIGGFPCVYEAGAATMPRAWLPPTAVESLGGRVCLYVVMDVARGVALSQLDLRRLTRAQMETIAFKLLAFILIGQYKMGAAFEHFDLHPDNIFVDIAPVTAAAAIECGALTGVLVKESKLLVAGCPRVQLIDFDLVNAEFGADAPVEFAKTLPEHTAKRTGAFAVPERTVEFALKWLGSSEQTLLLNNELRGVPNTDMRNWLLIVACMNRAVGDPSFSVRLCSSASSCLTQNLELFSTLDQRVTPDSWREILAGIRRYLGLGVAVHYSSNGDLSSFGIDSPALVVDVLANASEQAWREKANISSTVRYRQFLRQFLSSSAVIRDARRTFKRFDRQFFRVRGVHPTQDTAGIQCVVQKQVFFDTQPHRAVLFMNDVLIDVDSVVVNVRAPAGAGEVEVVFPAPAQISWKFEVWNMTKSVTAAFFKSVIQMVVSTYRYLKNRNASPPPVFVRFQDLLIQNVAGAGATTTAWPQLFTLVDTTDPRLQLGSFTSIKIHKVKVHQDKNFLYLRVEVEAGLTIYQLVVAFLSRLSLAVGAASASASPRSAKGLFFIEVKFRAPSKRSACSLAMDALATAEFTDNLRVRVDDCRQELKVYLLTVAAPFLEVLGDLKIVPYVRVYLTDFGVVRVPLVSAEPRHDDILRAANAMEEQNLVPFLASGSQDVVNMVALLNYLSAGGLRQQSRDGPSRDDIDNVPGPLVKRARVD